MPVIGKLKMPPGILERFQKMGPCLKPQQEIWWLSGYRPQMGIVEKVEEGRGEVLVRTRSGKKVTLDPASTLMLAAAEGKWNGKAG